MESESESETFSLSVAVQTDRESVDEVIDNAQELVSRIEVNSICENRGKFNW